MAFMAVIMDLGPGGDPSMQMGSIMENQMEKTMEHEMDIGVIQGAKYTNDTYIGPESL